MNQTDDYEMDGKPGADALTPPRKQSLWILVPIFAVLVFLAAVITMLLWVLFHGCLTELFC